MKKTLIMLANEAADPPAPVQAGARWMVPCGNSFVILQDDWIVVPYGDQEYDDGTYHCVQRLTRRAAENMVNAFHSWRGQITRRFAGLPWYIGHPDHPVFTNEDTDKKAYGWIMDLQALMLGCLRIFFNSRSVTFKNFSHSSG